MKRLFCIALLISLTLSITGCGIGGDLDIDIDFNISDKTLKYTLFANDLGAYSTDNRVVKKWEEQFNIELDFQGTGADWMETLCLRINADDMPELFFFVPNAPNYMTAYTNFVKNKLIIPISDLVTPEETPNLYALLNADDFSGLKIDDKMYFVPTTASDFNTAIYVRRDWMDRLGIKDPETIEDFTEMLRAFTKDDPDGNGKNDTYGMAASKVFEWMEYFKIAFGATPGWSRDVEGEWQFDAFTPGYKDFLGWMNGLYSNGYLKNEFYLYDDSEALNDFYNGKCGVVMYNGGRATGGVTYKMRKLDKNAVVDILPMPREKAEGGYTTSGIWWGGWSIAYNAKEPMRIVKMLDYFFSAEGAEERLYGLEGVHYNKDNSGEIILNFEERLKEKMFGATDDNQPRDYFAIGAYFGDPVSIENNRIKANLSDCIYSEPELAKRSSEYANRNLIRTPDTLKLGEEYAKTYATVSDRIYTYSVRIVAGSIGLNEGMETMKVLSIEDGYSKLQQIIKDHYGDRKDWLQ